MQYQKFDNHYVVVMHRGEQVMAGLSRLFEAEQLHGGTFWGLGAVDQAELAVYDVPNQKYHKRLVEGVFEVTNLTGTIGMKGQERVVHAHMTIADERLTAIGGHLVEARVSGTMEITVIGLPELMKKQDEQTGLWIFELPQGIV